MYYLRDGVLNSILNLTALFCTKSLRKITAVLPLTLLYHPWEICKNIFTSMKFWVFLRELEINLLDDFHWPSLHHFSSFSNKTESKFSPRPRANRFWIFTIQFKLPVRLYLIVLLCSTVFQKSKRRRKDESTTIKIYLNQDI